MRIFIGSENKLFSLSGSSLVVSPYMNADRKIIGAVGVIGPTRLNYGRIVPIVDYTAQLVGRLLSDRGQGVTTMSERKKDEMARRSGADRRGHASRTIAGRRAEIEALRAERDDTQDRFMRALADAENVRKRGERDRREAEQYGGIAPRARHAAGLRQPSPRARCRDRRNSAPPAPALIEGIELTLRELSTC